MPRRRDLNNLPSHVYRELYHFCMQYPVWEEKIRSCRSPKGARITEAPRSGGIMSPTEQAAEKAMALSGKVKLIQDTVKEICPPEAQKGILLNVTRDINYTTLHMQHGLYISEHDFKKYRRAFFYCLAVKKGRIET